MKLSTIITILTVILLFAFPPRVHASCHPHVFRLAFDDAGENYWIEEVVAVPMATEPVETAAILFNTLFEKSQDNVYDFPAETTLLNAEIHQGVLVLDVSREIMDYGGGTYLEHALMSQIIKTALDIDGVDKVTLLIENKLDALPEGSIIKEVTQWPEMTAEETTSLEK